MVRKFAIFLVFLVVFAVAGAFAYERWQASPQLSGVNYVVSLGDSVAAGDGLLAVPNASAEDTACGRSSQAYPYLLAQKLQVKALQYACSGAQASAGVLQPQTANGITMPAQLTSAQPYLKGNDVLVTIGANDVGWSGMLQRCAQSACDNESDRLAYTQSLQTLKANLETIFRTIHDAKPHGFVVNQYYSLLEPSDTCFASFGITRDKIQWVVDREAELNTTIAAVAKQNGAQVVPIDFSYHLLCNNGSWLQGLLGDAPLHPSAEGQNQIAQQDYAALK